MKRIFVILSCGLIAACNGPVGTSSGDADAARAIGAGEVALVATAPNGTQLWGVKPCDGCRVVYFSDGGTQTEHNESCGKNCNRTVVDQVPNQ